MSQVTHDVNQDKGLTLIFSEIYMIKINYKLVRIYNLETSTTDGRVKGTTIHISL